MRPAAFDHLGDEMRDGFDQLQAWLGLDVDGKKDDVSLKMISSVGLLSNSFDFVVGNSPKQGNG